MGADPRSQELKSNTSIHFHTSPFPCHCFPLLNFNFKPWPVSASSRASAQFFQGEKTYFYTFCAHILHLKTFYFKLWLQPIKKRIHHVLEVSVCYLLVTCQSCVLQYPQYTHCILDALFAEVLPLPTVPRMPSM